MMGYIPPPPPSKLPPTARMVAANGRASAHTDPRLYKLAIDTDPPPPWWRWRARRAWALHWGIEQ